MFERSGCYTSVSYTHLALNALKSTAEPYYDMKTKEWKVPTSYEEVYNLAGKNLGPVYNYFWGGKRGAPEHLFSHPRNNCKQDLNSSLPDYKLPRKKSALSILWSSCHNKARLYFSTR